MTLEWHRGCPRGDRLQQEHDLSSSQESYPVRSHAPKALWDSTSTLWLLLARPLSCVISMVYLTLVSNCVVQCVPYCIRI